MHNNLINNKVDKQQEKEKNNKLGVNAEETIDEINEKNDKKTNQEEEKKDNDLKDNKLLTNLIISLCDKINNLLPYIQNTQNQNDNMNNKNEINKILNSDDFIEEFILKNDKIKNAVILNYLESVSKPSINLLSSSTGNTMASTMKKPTTLEEARKIIELYY